MLRGSRLYIYTMKKETGPERGGMGGRWGAHQPRKRTLVPGGWEGRLLRRRRVEGRGWVEEDIIYCGRVEEGG